MKALDSDWLWRFAAIATLIFAIAMAAWCASLALSTGSTLLGWWYVALTALNLNSARLMFRVIRG